MEAAFCYCDEKWPVASKILQVTRSSSHFALVLFLDRIVLAYFDTLFWKMQILEMDFEILHYFL